MLSILEITLRPDEQLRINRHSAPLFHGALMELIDSDYAETLHAQGLKPYRTALEYTRERIVWRIAALSNDAHEQIIARLMNSNLEKLIIKNRAIELEVQSVALATNSSYSTLAEEYYLKREPSQYLNIEFNSPTTFKINNQHSIFFELKNYWASLINRWNAFADSISLEDESLLQHLVEHSKVIGYDMRSSYMYVGQAKIHGFVGAATILLHGPEQLKRLANLLAHYAEFSGVGAKTALGLGAVRLRN